MPGASNSTAEVTHVSRQGFWLLLAGEELLLPFAEFPWFRQATIEQLSDVQWPSPDHLYWPQLDVEIGRISMMRLALAPAVPVDAGSRHPRAGAATPFGERRHGCASRS